jgi:acyl carrier protein
MDQLPDLHDITSLAGEILRRPKVSPRSGFFELGGNSINALELSAGIEERWGISIPTYVIMMVADLRDLHARILREIGQHQQAGDRAEDGGARHVT